MSFAETFERCIVPTMSAQWAPRVSEAAGISEGDRVLDVGCGTGVLARTVADQLGPGGRVSGVDISEEMLAVARQIRPDIDWHRGDAGSLPFGDGEFDAVVSQFTLMFVPDPVTALKEMRRVLTPGGLGEAP